MKRLILGVMMFASAVASAAEAPRRVLWFGNSFTFVRDVIQRFSDLAVLAGHPRPVVVAQLEGGTDVRWHLTMAQSHPANTVDSPKVKIGAEGFTDVVIQGQSLESTSRFRENFVSSVEQLYAFVRAQPKGEKARCVLYETWARQPGHVEYPRFFPSADVMQDEVTAGYAQAAERLRARWGKEAVVIAPGGAAYRRLGYARDLYGPDLYHQSGMGAQLLAMQLFSTIYGEDVAKTVSFSAANKSGWTVGSRVRQKDEEWTYRLTKPDWTRLCKALEPVTTPTKKASAKKGKPKKGSAR